MRLDLMEQVNYSPRKCRRRREGVSIAVVLCLTASVVSAFSPTAPGRRTTQLMARSVPTVTTRPTRQRLVGFSSESVAQFKLSDLEEHPSVVLSPNTTTTTSSIQALLQRRQDILKQKKDGYKPRRQRQTRNQRQYLQTLFEKPSTTQFSNKQVHELYELAKKADQDGDLELARDTLQLLLRATPHDGRVYRRLARNYHMRGEANIAVQILRDGIREQPENAHLWQGLGSLYGKLGKTRQQRKALRQAIQVDPTIPSAYHALGTLEHAEANIAKAMRILNTGLRYCPQNHRLHHALGDLYHDAKLTHRAEQSYLKSVQLAPQASKAFGYERLAQLAYEAANPDGARAYLKQAILAHHGRHANSWKALARLQEQLGNVEAARKVCTTAIATYERGLLEKANVSFQTLQQDPVAHKNALLSKVPVYRYGDRFFNVYRTWLRLEKMYGDLSTFEAVYQRARIAFPNNYKIPLDAAEYCQQLSLHGPARKYYRTACLSKAQEPYRKFAEFELSLGNLDAAHQILVRAAGRLEDCSEVLYVLAVVLWRKGQEQDAAMLLEHAAPEANPLFRSLIWYARARLAVDQSEYQLAQHYVALILAENAHPQPERVWDLWADIATGLGNADLAKTCHMYAIQTEVRDSVPQYRTMTRRDPWAVDTPAYRGVC